MAKTINLALTSIVFSDHTELNLITSDFGESLASFTQDEEPAEHLASATSSIVSPKVYVMASIAAQIAKTSPKVMAYIERIKKNSSLNGSVTFTGDIVSEGGALEFVLTNATIAMDGGYNGDGKEGGIGFKVTGNYAVNEQLINGGAF